MTHDFLRPYGAAAARAGGSLWARRSGDLELFYPRNAAAATRLGVSSGSPWDWSAYSQIVASTSEDFVPSRLHAVYGVGVKTNTAMEAVVIEHEIATGAAASEVSIFRTYTSLATIMALPDPGVTQAISYVGHSPPFGPVVIPSGTRLSQRIRTNQAPADAQLTGVACYIAGHQDGDTIEADDTYDFMDHLAGVNAARTFTDPSGAGVTVTASAFPNYGSWTEVIAAAGADLLLQSVQRAAEFTGGVSNYMEIGVGASGSEVAIARIAFPGSSFSVGGNAGFVRPYRPVLILDGERVAVRTTGSTNAMPYYFTFEELNP